MGGGASGGAHLIFGSAMLGPELDEPGEGGEVSGAPDAIVAFSPIVEISKKGVGLDRLADPKEAKSLSPHHFIGKGLPPSIIFHGTADKVVPFAAVDRFSRKMRRKKNVCELVTFDGQDHSFFNLNVNMGLYEATLNSTDRFLVDHGFLAPPADEESGIGEALVGV